MGEWKYRDTEKRKNKTRINTESTEAECTEDTEKRGDGMGEWKYRDTEKRKNKTGINTESTEAECTEDTEKRETEWAR